MDNGTCELTDPPAGRAVANIMWIYNINSDTHGEDSRYKAHFVAKSCSQRAGLDYTKIFSPVILMVKLRLFLSIAGAMDLELFHLDIDTSMPFFHFLYAPIKEDVYIRQSLGFADGTPKVCHLKRCFYDLEQFPASSSPYCRTTLSPMDGNNAPPTITSTVSAVDPSST
jgi:hypothetical protein